MIATRFYQAITFAAVLMGIPLSAANSYSENYTFSNKETWEVPDATLPPGDYTITVHDKLLDREIFQVKGSKDGKVYSNFLAIPSRGGDPKKILRFWNGTGDIKALRGWFIPSDAQAWEFVYPKERAITIAKSSGAAVPAVDLGGAVKSDNTAISPDDLHAVQLWLLTPKRVGPGDEGVQIAAAKLSPRRVPTRPVSPAADETHKMPRTASNFLTDILCGLALMLSGAMLSGVLIFRRTPVRH